jgi:antitoxin HicB
MNKKIDVRGYALHVYQDPEDGAWVAEVPDLPGCVGADATPAGAIEQAQDAIEAWIEAAEATGRPVPQPRPAVDNEYSGRFVFRLPRTLHRRASTEAKREGVSLNTFCINALAYVTGLNEGLSQGTLRIANLRLSNALHNASFPVSYTGLVGGATETRRTVAVAGVHMVTSSQRSAELFTTVPHAAVISKIAELGG